MSTKTIFCALLIAIVASSCKETPTFSEIPHITFISFEESSTEAILTIEFQDGDGDIGSLDPNSHKDIQLTYYQKVNGVYTTLDTNGIPFIDEDILPRQNIPDLTPNGKNKVLEGEIQMRLDAPWHTNGMKSGEIYRYDIILIDRALNVSNVATTGDLAVK